MLAVFASTGGLTGLEAVVAGGTSAVGHKLLEALLGDQAVRTLAARARDDLMERVDDLLRDEAERFAALLEGKAPQADASRACIRRSTRSDELREARPRPPPDRARGGRSRRRRPSRPRARRARAARDREGGCTARARHRVDGRRARRADGGGEVASLQRAERRRAGGRRPSSTDHLRGSRGRVGRRRRPACSTGWRSSGATGSTGTSSRASSFSTCPTSTRSSRASARGRQDRRARRPPSLGRRAAEVRGRLAARRLPPASRDPRRRDGGRAQPGRPARLATRSPSGARMRSGCSRTTVSARRPCSSSRRAPAPGSSEPARAPARRRVAARDAAVARLAADVAAVRRRRCADGAATPAPATVEAGGAATARSGSVRGRGRPAGRRGGRRRAPSPRRAGVRLAARPAGSAVSGRTRCGASGSATGTASAGRRSRPRPTSSGRRSRPRCAASPTRRAPGFRRRGRRSSGERPRPTTSGSSTGSITPWDSTDLGVRSPRWWRVASLLQWGRRGRRGRRGALDRPRCRRRLPSDRGRRPASRVPGRPDRDVARPRRPCKRGSSCPFWHGSSTAWARAGGSAPRGEHSDRASSPSPDELVLDPIERELDAHQGLCRALDVAVGARPSSSSGRPGRSRERATLATPGA